MSAFFSSRPIPAICRCFSEDYPKQKAAITKLIKYPVFRILNIVTITKKGTVNDIMVKTIRSPKADGLEFTQERDQHVFLQFY